MSTPTSAASPVKPREKSRAARAGDYLDSRTGAAKAVKEFARKLFPDHWSFLLGEVALYSFIVLLLTGVFLAIYFVPSMGEVVYPNDQLPVAMQGVQMSEAYKSTLELSFEVRGGLLMRQMLRERLTR